MLPNLEERNKAALTEQPDATIDDEMHAAAADAAHSNENILYIGGLMGA
jgi:hypothetical protein